MDFPIAPPLTEADRALARMFGFRDEPTEAELIAADLAANRDKAEKAHAHNDARALNDQIMLQTLLRSSM